MNINDSGKVIYLPIRAFGDFIITASVVKDRIINKIPILLPDYLADFFFSIKGDRYFDVLNKIGYSNQPAFYELYKVKDLNNINRLLNDFKVIYSTLNYKDEYILDYSSKRLFFMGFNFSWPLTSENIYEGKRRLFEEKSFISRNSDNVIRPVELNSSPKILIMPDSRLKSKAVNADLIKKIIEHFDGLTINVAHFSQVMSKDPGIIYYSDFKELITLINTYDLIISAESLPYHLANYLGKPHFVVYNRSRHFKTTFMTPFMRDNSYYSIFDNNNFTTIITNVKKILYKC